MTRTASKYFRDGRTCGSRRHHGQDDPPRVGRGLQICVDCRNQVEEHLVGLPEWYEICAHMLDICRPQLRERVSGHRPHGIVLRDAVVTVRSDILGVLASWCGLVVGERGVPGPDELSIRELVTFIAIHLNWLTEHLAAPDLVDELEELSRAARAVVQPSNGSHVELGHCAESGCDAVVRAERPNGQDQDRVACDAGHVWRPEQWLLLKGHQHEERNLDPGPSEGTE